MSSFANAPQNQTFSFGPPTTTTTQNQPGNYTTIVNQRMGGGLGGYGSMGGYGGATGAPFNLSAANPMGAGLGGFGGFGGMGGYGFNPMMGGGFGGLMLMGGYGGFNPMMGGGFGGFGGMGGYGFNPMMGGGFGGFGYNPMMGGGFGGFGGMGGFGYNPMMGMGLGSFGGFGGFNPMMGGGFGNYGGFQPEPSYGGQFTGGAMPDGPHGGYDLNGRRMGGVNPPRGIIPSEPIPDPNDNFTASTQALIPATRDGVSGYYTDGSKRNFVPNTPTGGGYPSRDQFYSQVIQPTMIEPTPAQQNTSYVPSAEKQQVDEIMKRSYNNPSSITAEDTAVLQRWEDGASARSAQDMQAQMQAFRQQQQLLGRLGGFDPSMQAQQQQQELLRNSGLTQTRSGLSSENSNDPRMLELDRRRQEKLERDRARGYSLDAEYQYSPEQLAEIDRNFRLSKSQGGP